MFKSWIKNTLYKTKNFNLQNVNNNNYVWRALPLVSLKIYLTKDSNHMISKQSASNF